MQPVARQATCNQFRPIEPSFPLKAQVANPKKGSLAGSQPFAATRNTYLGDASVLPGLRFAFRFQLEPRQDVQSFPFLHCIERNRAVHSLPG